MNFADDIFKYIFLYEKCWNFDPSSVNDKTISVQIMAWCQKRWQAIIWINDGPFYGHIYALLGPNELMGHKMNEIYR